MGKKTNIHEDKKKGAFLQRFKLDSTSTGSLDNLRFSVKDVFDVAGYKTTFGNKVWASRHSEASSHAECINMLLSAGASCVGKTKLGEFCCGSEGKNEEDGMPLNPYNNLLVPGGSSSGSASSVGFGEADFSLGTDMAGSVRIPASYCGLYGFKPTHERVSLDGCLSLSKLLDTVGVLSASPEIIGKTLQTILKKNLDEKYSAVRKLIIIDELLNDSDAKIKEITNKMIDRLVKLYSLEVMHISLADLNEKGMTISDTLRYLLCGEIVESIGKWLEENDIKYGVETFVDFSYMKTVDPNKIKSAKLQQKVYKSKINSVLNGSIFCFPTLPILPRERIELEDKTVNKFNYERTRPYIAIASVAGLPQLTIPVECGDYSVGVSIVGEANTDENLINMAKNISKS